MWLEIPRSGYSTRMARLVVIATSPVPRGALAEHVSAEDEVVVVAPAVEQSRLEWLTNDDGHARADAEALGESIAASAPATARQVQVNTDPPSQAARDAVAEHSPDRVLVVLRTGDDATWLEEPESGLIPPVIDGVPVVLVRV